MKFRFEKIAVNSVEKRKPTPEDQELYIGLEHLESGNLDVPSWGSKTPLKGEKLVMKKGDVLFGKRNTYLRRVAIAPFDGIFSAHGMILRPNKSVIDDRFFPFFLMSDYFMKEAIRISVGSLSPTINWKDLKELEFNLPPIEEQARIADLLWAMNDTKKAYRNLLAATDELVKARFVEMFGDLITNSKSWPVYCFSEVATTRLGKMLDSKKQTGKNKFPYLGNTNVQWFKFDLNNLKQMDFDEEDQKEFCLQDGDLLVCEGGEIGRCAVWHNELQPCYYQKAIHRIRCNKEKLSSDFLSWWFRYYAENGGFIHLQESKSTIAHLPKEKLNHLQIAVPPLELQETFIQFTKRVLLIHKILDKSIESANEMLKSYLETVTA